MVTTGQKRKVRLPEVKERVQAYGFSPEGPLCTSQVLLRDLQGGRRISAVKPLPRQFLGAPQMRLPVPRGGLPGA